MRRIPIEPPSGSGPALGDPANPSYSVSVSDLEASGFRNAHKEETESKRMFSTDNPFSAFLPESISSAWEPRPAVAFAGVTGRRGSSNNRGRSSVDSMRISHESRRTGPHGPVSYLHPPGAK